jgi:predicted metal-dependent RNase
VLFATPGMLHGGTSLEVFKAWATDPKNLVLLPSYQVRPPTILLDVAYGIHSAQNNPKPGHPRSISGMSLRHPVMSLLQFQCRSGHSVWQCIQSSKTVLCVDLTIRSMAA